MQGEGLKEETAPDRAAQVRVGTMGWGYSDWNGGFYPSDAGSRDSISLYATAFDIVEIDSTFYGTPRENQVKQWGRSTPPNFLFCPKAPRLITHDMGLVDVMEPLKIFVRTMGLLGEKRGPMLLQMPPAFTHAQLPALQRFLPTLAELEDPDARFAIEFRHRSLISPEVSALLAEFGVALANVDYALMPRRFEITADFLYMRLIGRHGAFPQHRERQADRSKDMERWAGALKANAARYRAAYVFCNNDYEGYSPATANTFKTLLGLPIHNPPTAIQGSLF